ncbi:glycosyltransferase [Flavobacterium sp. 5]|uniref:glycosyltransferase family 2 protein n=1 Tax=Flavobacterium sp. 5 TaxID=2035199 RepID=UPI000C2C0240|nr:glycosyltransferase [Flavobacterium sp. 5]PKB15697.1 glycosyl transferase family 2 [Flavobacterium sp. 5]
MLSILIPIYNYNAFPLVLELQKQCLECNLEFEIICQNDASNVFLIENNEINILENCHFSSNETNLGRGRNINKMASKANYDWLLFLDCDTFPQSSDFIKNYLLEIQKKDNPIIFGGILYDQKKPEKNQQLRWVYGHKRESLSVEKRKEKPNNRALTSNLLLEKKLFSQYPFDENLTKYGYEDLYFMMILEENKIKVTHIENPTFHLNLETSILFLNKTKIALENLLFIFNSKKIDSKDSKIISTYSSLKKLRLTSFTVYLFNLFENKISTQLISNNPSLLLFDLYKLGYFCKLQSNNNSI